MNSSPVKRSFNLWYHDIYTDGINKDARFPRERYKRLLERLKDSTKFSNITIKEPNKISKHSLLLAHDESYVNNF